MRRRRRAKGLKCGIAFYSFDLLGLPEGSQADRNIGRYHPLETTLLGQNHLWKQPTGDPIGASFSLILLHICVFTQPPVHINRLHFMSVGPLVMSPAACPRGGHR